MLDVALIQRKLGSLLKCLNELEPLTEINLADYQAKYVERHAAEKLAELIVDFAIDINRAIIEAAEQAPADTYYNTFLEVERLGILPAGLTPRLASATGLRNRLVHQYDEVDNRAVYYSLKPLVRNYRQYARLIETYIRRETAAKMKNKKKK